MPYLVGWKPDGDLSYLSRDSKHTVQLVAVDPHLQKTDVPNLKLTRLSIRYVSSLIRQNNGTYQYESRRKEVSLEERALTLPRSGLTLALATDTPGEFAYVLADAAGQRLARIDYHVAGNANLTRTLDKDAQLQITLARPDYTPGDEIEMQIQAPYIGAGLITIERDRVYAWKWFHTTTTSSTQTIKLPPGIEGNAYVHVAFVRDPQSDEIYTSPLSYGVQPFSIALDARKNPVRLEVPTLVKPGEALKIGYSTQRPARIVLFAVDEGILQVAGYHTPDPLGHFFQKRSLAVTTTQILDLILPEFRRGAADAAPGGDRDGALGRHLNPFRRKGDKPVAWWSGVLDSDSTQRQVEYLVPDYFNGSLRVMAVAVSDDAIGVQQTSTPVRGDFVLSPNAPTTVTPGDEFEVSVGVANNLKGSGPHARIAVNLRPGPGLQLAGPTGQEVEIAENREGVASFHLRALDRLGPADLTFTASSAGACANSSQATCTSSVHRHIDLSIRPATPYMTTLTAGTLKQTTRDVPNERNLYPEYRTLEASTSLLPLSLAHGLVTYLAHYPYACTEQIVSQAVPALVLTERPEFGYVKTEPGADIQGLINELRVRQNDEGAYKLWPGGNDVVEFVSLYAQHFLLEASSRGQRVPIGLVDSGNGFLRNVATRDGDNLVQERDSAYAIYLLTRQGKVLSAEAAALRKRLTDRYKGQWEQDIAAGWLAASYKLMRQDRDAEILISRMRFGASAHPSNSAGSEDDLYDDDMTRDGFLLYLLARHFPEKLASLPPEVLDTLAARVTANAYNSLSAGATLLALDAYATATHAELAPHLSIAEILRTGNTVRPLELPSGLMPKVPFSEAARALRFGSGSDLNAYYLVTQAGFDRTPPREAISKGFEILREYTDSTGHAVSQIKMGEQLDVHLKFRALGDHRFAQVALVDLLPGGFDLVIPPQAANDSSVCGFCSIRTETLSYADPREDRVVFYVGLSPDVQEIVYHIKATNVGTYTTPPAYGEAMYDRGVVARSVAGRLEVVRP
jgi:uncharacterized protein YfaS (alpha-2-macroglobulin family)